MKDSTTKGFEQSYNCQSAVDEKTQVMVASQVTQQENDKEQVPFSRQQRALIYQRAKNVSDTNAQGIMGFGMLKQKAMDWLEDNSEDKKQLSEAQDEIATLKSQMAEMMAMMEQQTAPGEEVNETSIEEEEESEEALTTEE